jgi:exopolysaccharide production protein ExoZ
LVCWRSGDPVMTNEIPASAHMPISPLGVDVLRGIAAIAVLFAHADHAGLVKSAFLSQHKEFFGTFGVNLFFLLSGFLIWTSAKRSIDGGRQLGVYLVHRATRIMPLYYVNILFVVFVLPMISSTFVPNVTTETILRHVFFTQSLTPPVSRDLNPVLWTLTHEMLYYLSVPLLLLVSRKIGLHWLLVASGLLIQMAAESSATFAPFVGVLWLFLCGAIFASRDNPRIDGAVLLLLFGLYAYGGVRGMEQRFEASLLAICCFLMLMTPAAVNFLTKMSALFKPIAFAGLISYSLYIWHYLLINIIAAYSADLHLLLGSAWMHDGSRAVLVICSVFAVSALSYYLIELPSMGVLRRKLLVVLRLQGSARA